MDSVDTVEGFNHFYIYIWLLESCNDDSNLNAVPVTSACIRDHTLGIFLPFSENQITIMIPRIAKSRVVVRHY